MKRTASLLILLSLSLSVKAQFTLGGMGAAIGVAGTLQGIGANTSAIIDAKNQANRRTLRGSRLSEPSPDNSGGGVAGGADPMLGIDPLRGESGRPDPLGGADGSETPEVGDPFGGEANGGAGEGENAGVDDPFIGEANGGAGEGENAGVDDPFIGEANGGAGEGENAGVDDPFTGEANGASGEQEGKVCQVVVYGTSWCGYCTKAKDLLNAQGVSFTDKDIETDAGAREEMGTKMAQAGMEANGGVPVIDFCGRIIVGFNESLLLELCQNLEKK